MNVFDEDISEKSLAQAIVDRLSARELECFELLGRGTSTKEICLKLNITYHTAATHRARVIDKLGLRHSIEIGVLYWRTRKYLNEGLVIRQAPIRRPNKELNKSY